MDNFLAFLKLVKLFFFVIMIAHLIACIFLALVSYNKLDPNNSWLANHDQSMLEA
jgi:hypothetical protein